MPAPKPTYEVLTGQPYGAPPIEGCGCSNCDRARSSKKALPKERLEIDAEPEPLSPRGVLLHLARYASDDSIRLGAAETLYLQERTDA